MTSKTILVVDDSRVARMMTGAAVSRLHPDWRILEAASGEEAIEVAGGTAPDVILLDVNMPGMGGLAAARTLRQAHPAARISLLTANIQDPVREHAVALGLGFIAKPIDLQALAAVLDGEPGAA
jgi:CheY-like chemotaxis protein